MVLPNDLKADECHSFYGTYVKLVQNAPLNDALGQGKKRFVDFLQAIPIEKYPYRYAENKWSVAELVLHIIDAERVFQYRALRFARNDATPLPGFDQDCYVPESNAGKRTKDSIIWEYETVRNATISLFGSFESEALLRKGLASGSPMSVRALGFVICGHQMHHQKILEERYL
jgi:uncharacterized damage-inducible protein DinB